LAVVVVAVVLVVLVTGAPPPVSVAVVPVDDGWMVSVGPTLLPSGLRLHAIAAARRTTTKALFMLRIGANVGPA
jgi:hypothetical protein